MVYASTMLEVVAAMQSGSSKPIFEANLNRKGRELHTVEEHRYPSICTTAVGIKKPIQPQFAAQFIVSRISPNKVLM
jgi:hypothetical protein